MAPPIVEAADAPRGWTEIKIRDSKGVRIGFFQVSSVDMDDELADALRSWQRRHAHRGLTLMLSSASAG